MSTKPPEIWASDPQARALRVEVSPEWSLLVPFNQFSFSELISDGKGQRLRLVFATHEVLVRGYALRRVEAAMQRMELSFISKVPDRYRALFGDGQPFILEILVTEAKPANQPALHSAS
jgi:hypothetical protein